MKTDIAHSGFVPAPRETPFTPEEENVVRARLFTLLSKQARLRTQGDHSSLREEDVAELLASLVFSLRLQLQRDGLPLHALLTADLAGILRQAQRALQTEMNTAQTLYTIALRRVAAFGSRALTDTLAGIGVFFKRYDFRLYAHEIPASIDYPLCHPISEEWLGVLYIRTYLERLLTENKLITCFAPERVEALERRASPDYRDLLQNLYEPAAANVIGLTLLDGDETLLEITREQAVRIHRIVTEPPEREGRGRLAAAAKAACESLSLAGADSLKYLSWTAEALYPRIVVSPQSAAGVFSTIT